MQREHRQCTESSEGLSLIFVPSFGKVEVIQKENTRLQLCTNSSEVMSMLFVPSSGKKKKLKFKVYQNTISRSICSPALKLYAKT